MSNKLRVRFGNCKNGWLNLCIQWDDQQLEFTTSDIPYNSLYELASGLLIFAKTGRSTLSRWNTEPDEYDFVFSQNASNASFEIIKYPDDKRVAANSKTILTITGTAHSLITPFWRALRSIENNEDLVKHWKWEFPTAEVEQLSTWLKLSN